MTETQTVDLAAVQLVAWLTRIWDEEERLAKAATPGPWRYNKGKHTHLPGSLIFEEAVFTGPAGPSATTIAATGETDDPQSMTDAAFIAAHDPASVLARIAADRKILELHSAEPHPLLTRSRVEPYPSERLLPVCGECSGVDDPYIDQVAYPCTTLRLLASPYADRPGFREEWR